MQTKAFIPSILPEDKSGNRSVLQCKVKAEKQEKKKLHDGEGETWFNIIKEVGGKHGRSQNMASGRS